MHIIKKRIQYDAHFLVRFYLRILEFFRRLLEACCKFLHFLTIARAMRHFLNVAANSRAISESLYIDRHVSHIMRPTSWSLLNQSVSILSRLLVYKSPLLTRCRPISTLWLLQKSSGFRTVCIQIYRDAFEHWQAICFKEGVLIWTSDCLNKLFWSSTQKSNLVSCLVWLLKKKNRISEWQRRWILD